MPDEVNPEEHTKDELQEMAEAEGVDASGTKAEITERLGQANVTNPDFDPDNPGGESFDYGQVEDPEKRAELQGQSTTEFDPDNPGGQAFDSGRRPEE